MVGSSLVPPDEWAEVDVIEDQRALIRDQRHPSELRLFANPESFEHHTAALFELLRTDHLEVLIKYVRSENWLNNFVERLTDDDLEALLAGHQEQRLKVSIPLFNLLPIKKLELFDAEHFEILEKATRTEKIELFDRRKLYDMSLAWQKHMAPKLPSTLQPFLKLEILQELIQNGRCDLLGASVLNRLPSSLSSFMSGDCMGKLVHDTKEIIISEENLKLMPDDAFRKFKAELLSPATYRHMNLTQLALHLQAAEPTEGQLLAVPLKLLIKALALVSGSADSAAKVAPKLVASCPVSAVHVFGRIFWEHADPTKNWTLAAGQLEKLPETAFASAEPTILRRLKIVNGGHLQSNRVKAIITRLGTVAREDGKHPCMYPASLLHAISPSLIENLKTSCVAAMEPVAMASFTQPAHLNHLSSDAVSTLKAEHITLIPITALNDSAQVFLKHMVSSNAHNYKSDDIENLLCSGLTIDHVRGFRNSTTWKIFDFECFISLESTTLMGIPIDGMGQLKPEIFEDITTSVRENGNNDEIMVSILEKMSPRQMELFGTAVDDETAHPCHNVYISWGQIGQQTANSYPKMPPQCFGLLNTKSYEYMPQGAIRKMSDEILEYVTTPERFAMIPASALIGIRDKQMEYLKIDAVQKMLPDQMLAIAQSGASALLGPDFLAAMPIATFIEGLRSRMELNDNALSEFTDIQLSDGIWIGQYGNLLSFKQWRQLSKNVHSNVHPCASLQWKDIEVHSGRNKTSEFWRGLSAECFSALSCIDKLTKAEESLIPSSAYGKLDLEQKFQLDFRIGHQRDKMMHGQSCANHTAQSFSKLDYAQLTLLSAKCYAQLQLAVVKSWNPTQVELFPSHAFKRLQSHQAAVLSVDVIAAITDIQWKQFSVGVKGSTCAGFTATQIPSLPIAKLSGECIGLIRAGNFQKFSQPQFEQIPIGAWQHNIGKLQVEALPYRYFAEFRHFSDLGRTWPESVKMHPCLGIQKSQVAKFKGSVKADYEQHCVWIQKQASFASAGPNPLALLCVPLVAVIYLVVM